MPRCAFTRNDIVPVCLCSHVLGPAAFILTGVLEATKTVLGLLFPARKASVASWCQQDQRAPGQQAVGGGGSPPHCPSPEMHEAWDLTHRAGGVDGEASGGGSHDRQILGSNGK